MLLQETAAGRVRSRIAPRAAPGPPELLRHLYVGADAAGLGADGGRQADAREVKITAQMRPETSWRGQSCLPRRDSPRRSYFVLATTWISNSFGHSLPVTKMRSFAAS